jgi:hypothetical protein
MAASDCALAARSAAFSCAVVVPASALAHALATSVAAVCFRP